MHFILQYISKEKYADCNFYLRKYLELPLAYPPHHCDRI